MKNLTGAAASFDVTDQNRVKQIRDRGHYDHETVFDILDRGLVAHVAFVDDGRPVVMPMAYGRKGDRIFIHGAKKSRIAKTMASSYVSIGVTLVDGLVVGRSIFESSMNYRAVVIHGQARTLTDPDERLEALRCVSEHNLPGRWDEVRPPLVRELAQTGVLEVQIETASAKIRNGPPIDDYEDYDHQTWVGIVPVVLCVGRPIRDSNVAADVKEPASVSMIRKG